MQLYEQFKLGNSDEQKLLKLSSQFYSLIPHRLGTKKTDVQKALINSTDLFEEKQNLLQLMKDIIKVQQKRGKQLDTNRGTSYLRFLILILTNLQLKLIASTTLSIVILNSWTRILSSLRSWNAIWSNQSRRIRPKKRRTSLKSLIFSPSVVAKKSYSLLIRQEVNDI